MGVAKYTAIDPYSLSVTVESLYDLLSEIDGVLEWIVHLDGEVTVEYDHNRISEETIEQLLSGVGLRLKYVTGDPHAALVAAPEVLN